MQKEKVIGDQLKSVRIRDQRVDVYSDEPRSYWHNKLYLGHSIEDKLSAIDELVRLQESDLLASGLGNRSVEVRTATINGLTLIGDVNSVQLLGQAMFSEKNEDVHFIIIKALNT